MKGIFFSIVRRDLRLSVTRGGDAALTFFFFILAVAIFHFASPHGGGLEKSAPAILWAASVMASLLSLEAFYHRDAQDGTFDLLLLSRASSLALMTAKVFAHWLAAGVFVVLAAGLASLMVSIPASAVVTLLAALTLATLYMSLLGGFGAVLTMGARAPGLLLCLLVLPLYIPMLVFGALATAASLEGMAAKPYLLLQGALVVAILPLSLWAGGAALRMQARS